MKNIKYYSLVSLGLVICSLVMFYFHYLIFGEINSIIDSLLKSLCLAPINFFIATVVFDNIMDRRVRKEKISKMNMLVGVFFSEIGFKIIDIIAESDDDSKNLVQDFYEENELEKLRVKILNHPHEVDIKRVDFNKLEEVLVQNQGVIINLITNENISEHEIFSDLLMSTLHLRDEIAIRKSQNEELEEYEHLKVDIERVYEAITSQWIDYLSHIKEEHPYLYKTAMEVNPFK